ncbi:MAG: ABC transporter ATP-binding protein, partial [Candidatus Saccharimonadales bacterium]
VLTTTVVPLLVGKILASLTLPNDDPMKYLPYFIVVAAIGLAANRFGFKYMLQLQAKVMSKLQARSLEALLKRSVGFHNNNMGGKLVSDAIDFPGAYGLLLNATLVNLVPLALVLTTGSIMVFTESWALGLVITAMASYALLSGIFDSISRKPVRQNRLKATKAVTGHLADAILNVQTVKTFAREENELKTHRELNTGLLNLRLRDWNQGARQGNQRMIILTCMQLAFIVLSIKMVQNDQALLGIGIFAFSFTMTISNRLFEINSMLRNIEEGLLQASPMTEILLEDIEVHNRADAKKLQIKKGTIKLENVDFQYADSTSDQAVFSHLQLNITPGEKVGLVGPSGGGKSTLTRLLLRFDDVTSGTISIDDQDIAGVTQKSLRQAISYVPQEPLLFHRTIRENISYGQPDATEEMIIKAAKKANAHEFISDLPAGYDTLVGERGVKLSGGQRQRVAIARAILKDAPILILDEATSALDSESERLIQDALRGLMRGRTSIVIAHRLSTIQKMDRILVLENGEIAEQGTHDQLLAHKGTYAKLWKHQSGGFLED